LIGFIQAAEGVVPESWIDVNGHMNIMWYTQIFDRGCEAVLKRLGITEASIKLGGITVVAARILTIHRREMLLGDKWHLWSALLTATPLTLTFSHRLVVAGGVKAVCHIQSQAFDPVSRSQAKLSHEILSRAERLLVSGVIDPFIVRE